MSLITSKVASCVRTSVTFFKKAYNNSATKIINDKIVSGTVNASKKSFICNTLSSQVSAQKKFSEGFIYYLSQKIGRFLSAPFKFVGKALYETYIFRLLCNFPDIIVNLPLRLIGIFLILFALIFVPFGILDEYSQINNMLCTICLITGVVLSFIKYSFLDILYNSFLFKTIKRIFTQDFSDKSTFKSETLPVKKQMYIIASLLGAIFGCASVFTSPLAMLAVIIGILGIVTCLKYFKIGAFIVILMFPFLPTMIIVGLLLLSFVSLILNTLFNKDFKFKKTNLDIYLILFAFVIFISGLTSFDPSSSINIALVYLVFICSYFVYTNTITTKKDLYTTLVMLIFSATLVSLYGIYQYFFGFAEGSVWIDTSMFEDISTRVVSTFENPNVLGEYLLLIIPVIMAFLFVSRKKTSKLSALTLFAISALCMVFTFSRGCWIGLIVSFVILSVFYDRRFLWIGIILVLFAPVYLPESIIQRFLSVGDTADTSTSYRVYIWFGTIDMLKDYWLTGIGLGEGAFNIIYPHYSYSAIVAPHSHNLYLQIIVENGIVGMIVFVSTIFIFYKNSISTLTRIRKGFLKTTLLCLVAAMTGYLVQGLFDNVWYNYRIVMFFFMILAIASQCANIAIESDFKKEDETNAQSLQCNQ